MRKTTLWASLLLMVLLGALLVAGQTLIKPQQIERNWTGFNLNASNITAERFFGPLNGTATNATFAANAGNATFAANAGNATFSNNAGNATFVATAGNSTFASSSGNSTFAGSSGNATFSADAGNATFSGRAGNATFAATSSFPPNATFAGSTGNATFSSTANYRDLANQPFTDAALTVSTAKTALFLSDVIFFANITPASGAVINGSFVPRLDAAFTLGNSTLRWLNGNFSGGVTAATFSGSLSGVATNATFAGNSGNATFAGSAGNSTFSANTSFANAANYNDLSNKLNIITFNQTLNTTSNVTFVNISLENKGLIYHNGTHLVLVG